MLKIYPFGNRAFLWADGDQYIGIDGFYGSVADKNTILYSWGNVLGGNALPEMAYYAFSPINVIFMLFDNNMMVALHIVVYLKFLISALSFCFCLSYVYKDDNYLLKALLSTSYAFMGYTIFFGWNASWMDGIILLPIMVVGLYKLVKEERYILYSSAIALAIITNFYIGYMLCLTSFIIFISLLMLLDEAFSKGVLKKILEYVFSSIIGVGCSAFILLPTYLALPTGRKMEIRSVYEDMRLIIKPADIFSNFFTGTYNSSNDNAPLIYVGIVVFLLDILFFVSQNINIKRKMVALVVIIVFFASFENSFFNLLWHGFSENVCFNYRYSFIFSFILLIMAYDIGRNLHSTEYGRQEIGGVALIFFVVVIFVLQNAAEKIQTKRFFVDCIIVAVLLICFAFKYNKSRIFKLVLACTIIYSTIVSNNSYLKDTVMYSVDSYNSVNAMMEDAIQNIDDDSFYRMDKDVRFGRCDANLFNYKGISNYASTEDYENLEYIKKLGVQHAWMWAQYTPNVPMSTESLLGLKYILSSDINHKDYDVVGAYGGTTYYRNKYAMPIIFPASTIQNVNLEIDKNFDLMNKIWKSINGFDEDTFVSNLVYIDQNEEQKTINISIENTGSVYVFVPAEIYSNVYIEGNQEFIYDSFSEIFYVGEMKAGDSFKMILETEKEDANLSDIMCYTENKIVLRCNTELVKGEKIQIEEVSSSHLEVTYEGNKKNIATTIPFDEGWKVYDNGSRLALDNNWGNFVAFELNEGYEHQIKLIYRPAGFYLGIIITLSSLAVMGLFELIRKRKANK